jgi:hypothetical protein
MAAIDPLVGRRVTEYRVYFIGSDGHFVRFVGLSCSDDAKAIEQARRLTDSQDVELWSGDRFIVRLEHKPNPPR